MMDKEETTLTILLDCFNVVADGWIDFFVFVEDKVIGMCGAVLIWVLIIVTSPVWVGPFLLWRKFHKGKECSE